jgi:rhomboid protease GluP
MTRVQGATLLPNFEGPGRRGEFWDPTLPSRRDDRRRDQRELPGPPEPLDLPWATIGLTLIILVGFIAVAPTECSMIRAGALVRPFVLQGHEWFRLLTPALLHGSTSHWFWNTVALLVAGWSLEPLIGAAWLLALFIAAVVGGALLSLLLGDYTLSIGASGGILGLFAAKLVVAYMHYDEDSKERRQLVAGSVRVVILSLLPSFSADGPAIDLAAHWGGAMAGTVFAFVLAWHWDTYDNRPPGHQRIAWTVVAGAVAVVIWGLIVAATHDPGCRGG